MKQFDEHLPECSSGRLPGQAEGHDRLVPPIAHSAPFVCLTVPASLQRLPVPWPVQRQMTHFHLPGTPRYTRALAWALTVPSQYFQISLGDCWTLLMLSFLRHSADGILGYNMLRQSTECLWPGPSTQEEALRQTMAADQSGKGPQLGTQDHKGLACCIHSRMAMRGKNRHECGGKAVLAAEAAAKQV